MLKLKKIMVKLNWWLGKFKKKKKDNVVNLVFKVM